MSIAPPTCSSRPVRGAHNRIARRGFSLVELLFVMGIIVVIAAILLPGVTQARRQAKLASCANQLHQIHIAASTWKMRNQPKELPAKGWKSLLTPYVEDQKLYNCPESKDVLEGNDTERAGDRAPVGSVAGGGGGGSSSGVNKVGGTTADAPVTPGSDLSKDGTSITDLYLHIEDGSGGYVWDVPLAEGPWIRKEKETGNSYELWIEDWGGRDGGDKDFKDIGIKVTDLGDGRVNVELAKRPDGKSSSHNVDVLAADPNGGAPRKIWNDTYKSGGSQAGDGGVTLGGPFNYGGYTPPPPGGTAYNGSTDGSGIITEGMKGQGDWRSSYALSTKANRIEGMSDKVFGMDYTGSVIDPEKDNWSLAPFAAKENGKTVMSFARHVNHMANILYGDGSVRPERVSEASLNPAAVANYSALWDK